MILKSSKEAEFVVATDASKVGFVGVLLQEDSDGNLKSCAYWARKLKDARLGIVLMIKRHWPLGRQSLESGGCICSIVYASQ